MKNNISIIIVFTISFIVGFFATTAIINNKGGKEVNEGTEVAVTDAETAKVNPDDEHDHIWESVGHTEVIGNKCVYVEDFERCTICGDTR